MSTKVQAIPERYKAATPYLSVDGAARAIEFYKQAFGAVETMRMDGPGGRIMHAEVTIGAAPIMLADEFPEMGFRGPEALGGSPVHLYVYVEDVARWPTARSRPVQRRCVRWVTNSTATAPCS